MKALLTSFVSGLIFALGLGISGMTRPVKVVGFLDFFGHWNPSLGMVMLGAIGVHAIVYRMVQGRRSPVFAARFAIPPRAEVDWRLVGGAALFGLGWGLAGYCPGPAVTSLASGSVTPLLFVIAMVGGMAVHARLKGRAEPFRPAGVREVLATRQDS